MFAHVAAQSRVAESAVEQAVGQAVELAGRQQVAAEEVQRKSGAAQQELDAVE